MGTNKEQDENQPQLRLAPEPSLLALGEWIAAPDIARMRAADEEVDRLRRKMAGRLSHEPQPAPEMTPSPEERFCRN